MNKQLIAVITFLLKNKTKIINNYRQIKNQIKFIQKKTNGDWLQKIHYLKSPLNHGL